MQYMPLTSLELSKTAIIYHIYPTGDLRHRLLDLGFTPGASITPLFRSPLGDPTAYEVLGSVIALRQEDAMQIEVECPTGEAIR